MFREEKRGKKNQIQAASVQKNTGTKKIKYMLYLYKKVHATPRVESVYPVGHALAHGGPPRSTQWNI